MFLRSTICRKDGKEHRYWSVVEARRVAGGRVVQRPVLYLGEINSSQELAWRKSIEVLEQGSIRPRTLALFPEDRCEGVLPDASIVRLKLSQLRLERPRQWGACWLALTLWQELKLDLFWGERLPASRKGTRWDLVLFVLVAYRLVAPDSEWRLHCEWYAKSALMDLLGTDETLADIHALYRCHDRLLEHKQALFDHLVGRWRDLFNACFDVLLYDLTSTYFEANPPFPDDDKRRFGYSRDKRSDCVQVVIALIVTPEGLPLAYEVLPGNTADCTTLKGFLAAIERQYGKARRVWVMDRGIPTEAVLEEMRRADPPVSYLVGTPKGRLSRLEQALVAKPCRIFIAASLLGAADDRHQPVGPALARLRCNAQGARDETRDENRDPRSAEPAKGAAAVIDAPVCTRARKGETQCRRTSFLRRRICSPNGAGSWRLTCTTASRPSASGSSLRVLCRQRSSRSSLWQPRTSLNAPTASEATPRPRSGTARHRRR